MSSLVSLRVSVHHCRKATVTHTHAHKSVHAPNGGQLEHVATCGFHKAGNTATPVCFHVDASVSAHDKHGIEAGNGISLLAH